MEVFFNVPNVRMNVKKKKERKLLSSPFRQPDAKATMNALHQNYSPGMAGDISFHRKYD